MWHDVCFDVDSVLPMPFPFRFAFLGSTAAAAVACAAACGGSGSSDGDSSEDAITKPGDASPPWLYEGPLPALDSPKMVTSISGHTLHITGLLPAGYAVSKLPWYVASAHEGSRVRVHVVYPIATGQMVNGAWNNVPGVYDHLNVRPYRPNDPAAAGKEHWGGFPFLNYHDARRFAMHGPIDFTEDFDAGPEPPHQDWRLVRGRISHGCNRMQGEHLIELTHMLGFDMSKPWTTELNKKDPKNGVEGKWIPADLTVLAEPQLDVLGGAIVDVDYPKDPSVPALPAGRPVHVFPTWDADVMLAWACSVKPADDPNKTTSVKRTDARFDGHYCARTNGANKPH
jgi:hypothetical protein